MTPDAFNGVVQAAETGLSPFLLASGFVVGTLISEDLTCITAGLLVAHGAIGFVPAMLATLAGIFVGDVLLYLAGWYFGPWVLRSRFSRRLIKPQRIEASEEWFQRRGPVVILISRFVPGSRLPVYVASGMLRLPLRRVAPYFALAGVLWTPALVGLATVIGEHAIDYLHAYGRATRWAVAALALAIWFAVRLVMPLCSSRGRRLLLGRFKRICRWEFWPMWAVYPPVIAYLGYLACKFRSLTVFTAANPGIPAGGFIGEPKADILGRLTHAGGAVACFRLIVPDGGPGAMMAKFQAARGDLGLAYPVVLKPDAGQRGEGVAIVRTDAQAAAYFGRKPGRTLLQAYAPGQEFGVFYYRYPHEPHGHIYSVTEKRIPFVVGDGRRKLADLILRDDRAVCMAEFYLNRNRERLDVVIPDGEAVPLADIGNHCRGAVFLNGDWVVTPAFEAEIDRISRGFEGFFFGRYDIRTPDVAAMQQGRDFKIVELNGVTSEATHIYDPGHSIWYAYGVLMRQWRIAFEIGAQNRARGAPCVSALALWRMVRTFKRAPEVG
ncbi:MAG: VTT domain-containing protein [Lentisphaerae bacterium]|nr:VTT domain-containing protein [Lentisphaerota bacterium]